MDHHIETAWRWNFRLRAGAQRFRTSPVRFFAAALVCAASYAAEKPVAGGSSLGGLDSKSLEGSFGEEEVSGKLRCATTSK